MKKLAALMLALASAMSGCVSSINSSTSAEEIYKEAMSLQRRGYAYTQQLQKAADLGYTQAQFHLGSLYENNDGRERQLNDQLPLNAVQAALWYEKAARQGHAEAQYRLGTIYLTERGISSSKYNGDRAVEWFEKATEQGHVEAHFALVSMYAPGRKAGSTFSNSAKKYGGVEIPQNGVKAAQWLQKAAERGDASVQYRVGKIYEEGAGNFKKTWGKQDYYVCEYPVPRNAAAAARYYQKAAEQGHVQASLDLGSMYAEGRGVPQDAVRAEQWFQKAADQGGVQAQYPVGEMYEKGRGVPQDYAKAAQWYQKVAGQGGQIGSLAKSLSAKMLWLSDEQKDEQKRAEKTRGSAEAEPGNKYEYPLDMPEVRKIPGDIMWGSGPLPKKTDEAQSGRESRAETTLRRDEAELKRLHDEIERLVKSSEVLGALR